MDTKQLLTFVTLADTLNYQRAAERLQYAPSSLFRHIQLLEEELGAPLFYKSGRQLELTEDGRRLLPDAERLLSGWKRFLDAARESESARALAIGGCEMNTSFSLVGLLSRFAAQCPEVSFSMTTSPNASVPDLLRGGMIDLGFYYSTQPRCPQGLSHIPMYSEPLYPCAAPGNPLLGKEGLHWRDLNSLAIVHPHDNCCFMTGYRDAMGAAGCQMGTAAFLGGISLVAEHALREGKLMLIPYHALPKMEKDFGILPLSMAERPMIFWESVLYRDSESLLPSARRLIRFAAAYAREQAQKHPEVLTGPESYEPFLSEL